jgi:hypothetical protein
LHRGPGEVAASTVLICVAVGLVGGWLGVRWYGAILARRVRGRSEAHHLVSQADIAAFGGFSVLFYTLALAAMIAWAGG